MAAYLALLRGINVGGKHSLPMKVLTQLFQNAGCQDVRTYIQSGNVMFDADEVDTLANTIGERIEQQHGFRPPIILRARDELQAAVARNPFLSEGTDPDSLHVAFLADAPPAVACAQLDPTRSPPDRFAVIERHIYLHCPDGFGNTKLTNSYFDSKLATVSTIRNWRTVKTLLHMLNG